MTERDGQSITNIDIAWTKTPEERRKAGIGFHDSLVQWHKYLHSLGLSRVPIALFEGDKYRIAFSDLGLNNKIWQGTTSVTILFGEFKEDEIGKKYCIGTDNKGVLSVFPYIKGKGGASFEMVKSRFRLGSQHAVDIGITTNVFQDLIYKNFIHIGQILSEKPKTGDKTVDRTSAC